MDERFPLRRLPLELELWGAGARGRIRIVFFAGYSCVLIREGDDERWLGMNGFGWRRLREFILEIEGIEVEIPAR